MSINSKLIEKKEEVNKTLEKYADEALLKDKKIQTFNNPDDVQTAVLFVLERFRLNSTRGYGVRSLENLLELHMDPLDVMYRASDSIKDEIADKSQYILAFNKEGEAYVLYPTLIGYSWFKALTSEKGFVTKKYVETLKDGCYVFTQPLKRYKSILITFIVGVLKHLTTLDIILLVGSSALMTVLGLYLPKINSVISL